MIDELQTLAEKAQPIFEKYGFRKVGIFGSRARGDNRPDSDVDLLYSMQGRSLSLFEKHGAEEELKEVLGMDVDLVPDTHIVARMRPNIKRDLKILYEGQ